VAASAKATPCLLRLAGALRASHSNVTSAILSHPWSTPLERIRRAGPAP
jgi:hypothetical protein